MPMHIAFEKYTLSNGLDVILHEDHSIPMAAVNVWYHVGSQNEEPDRTGFAHLFEHLMFEGSKNHNQEYFGPLQEVGRQHQRLHQHRPHQLLRERPCEVPGAGAVAGVGPHGLPPGRAGPAQLRRFNATWSRTSGARATRTGPTAWPGRRSASRCFRRTTPTNWQTIGSQEHLDAASLEDVKDFFRRFYAPNNASLAIAGDIDPAEAKALVGEVLRRPARRRGPEPRLRALGIRIWTARCG